MKRNTTPEVGSFVRIGLATILIDEIDTEQNEFFGSDADGDARWYSLDQIDAVIP
jgi:hypothetical protein